MVEGCEALVKAGELPACVAACPVHARSFGDINDPESEISRRIASSRCEKILPQKGTKPNFFVVVSK